jgi:hypothetical protein
MKEFGLYFEYTNFTPKNAFEFYFLRRRHILFSTKNSGEEPSHPAILTRYIEFSRQRRITNPAIRKQLLWSFFNAALYPYVSFLNAANAAFLFVWFKK